MKTKHTQGEWTVRTETIYIDPYGTGDSIAHEKLSIVAPFNKGNSKITWSQSLIDKGAKLADLCGYADETSKANAKLMAAAPVMLKALEYYKKGIRHFYDCINFGSSALDAEAIAFMNESGIKINQAVNKATE